MAAAALFCLTCGTASAQTIQIHSGPGGNDRISTPWGDYVAVYQGGTLFVVSEADYAKGLIDGYARKNNQVAVDLVGMGRTYVSKNGVNIQIGQTKLWDVYEEVVFGVPPSKRMGRPPKPRDSEYVQFVWMQQGKGKVQMNLAIDGTSLKPNSCGTGGGFFHCEFTVPHPLIPKPAIAIFSQPNEVPGIWRMPSISSAYFKAMQGKYAELKMPITAEDERGLRMLRSIDPSIPASVSE